MMTAYNTKIDALTNAGKTSRLDEDTRNEMLRMEILENRRVQQINTLKRIDRSNQYFRM